MEQKVYAVHITKGMDYLASFYYWKEPRAKQLTDWEFDDPEIERHQVKIPIHLVPVGEPIHP